MGKKDQFPPPSPVYKTKLKGRVNLFFRICKYISRFIGVVVVVVCHEIIVVWTWVVEEILGPDNKLRSTQFPYLKLCNSAYFGRTT